MTNASTQPRVVKLTLAAGLGFVIVFAAFSVFYARTIDWNAMRIWPVFAFLHGSPLYPPREGGLVTGNIYPPLADLAYLPCALLRNPSHIMEFGSLLACLYYLFPLGLLACLAVRRWAVSPTDAALVFAAAALLTDFDPALRYTAFMAHAEAPGFALAGLALCLVLFRNKDEPVAWMTAAGALAAAAVLAKQTFVGVWLVLFLCLLPRGRRIAAHFAAGAALVAAPFCALLLLTGNLRAFLFNCIYIPSHQPWSVHAFILAGPGGGGIFAQRLQAVVESFLQIAPSWLPWMAAGAWILWFARRAAPDSPGSRLIAPVSVFAAQVPLSLMAYKKIGGDVNNLAGSLYFLLLALCAFALVVAANRAWSAAQRAALAILVGGLIFCNTPRLLFLLQNSGRPDPNAGMMTFLGQHPGQVFLPWNPLLTSLSDGADYQFEYGVFDRALAGVPMAQDAYRAHLPRKLLYVAMRRGQPDESHGMFLTYLPGLRESPAPTGLQDWRFFAVPQP